MLETEARESACITDNAPAITRTRAGLCSSTGVLTELGRRNRIRLREAFARFGEVTPAVVMRKPDGPAAARGDMLASSQVPRRRRRICQRAAGGA